MKDSRQIQSAWTIRVVTLTTGALMASAAFAQGTPTQGYPAQTPSYPVQTQAYPSYPAPAPAAAPPRSHPIRDLFAGTIATVLQTATGGLSSALSGSILNWFAKRQTPGAAAGYAATPYAGTSYPTTAYPSQNTQGSATSPYTATGAYPSGATSTYPAPSAGYPGTTAQYPGTTYPTPTTAAAATAPAATGQVYGSATGGYGQSGTYAQPASQVQGSAYSSATTTAYDSAQVYDARTGQLVTGGANPYATPAGGQDGTLYAGIAYEVHALGADGSSTPINPATYVFRTGDKFMVYYRPSLPGRMEVYNINPAGQRTLIDSSNMAAGQMTTLGPYEFTKLTGDESLRLVLSPCSSPQLLATTRDIVRADSPYPMTPQASPMANSSGQLSTCGATTTRGLDVRTRDIQKVAVDGTTSYALDPVSQHELTTGQVTPREANIVLHHR
jgi:hypothetical protein